MKHVLTAAVFAFCLATPALADEAATPPAPEAGAPATPEILPAAVPPATGEARPAAAAESQPAAGMKEHGCRSKQTVYLTN